MSLSTAGDSEAFGCCVGSHSIEQGLHGCEVKGLLHVGSLGLEGDIGGSEDALGQVESRRIGKGGGEVDIVAYFVLLEGHPQHSASQL